MAVTREAVAAEARQWIGTPFQHAQHCKGKGCDCIGLVIGVFQALGCLPPNYITPAYSRQWHAHKNEEVLLGAALGMGFIEKPGVQPEVGDLLVFKFGRVISHAGICVSETEFVHAYQDMGRVVMQPLRGDLKNRLRKILIAPWVN